MPMLDPATQPDAIERAAQRLADFARFVRHAEAPGDLTIGHGAAGRDGACHLVDLAVEFWRGFQIERNVGEVGCFALQELQHAFDGAADT